MEELLRQFVDDKIHLYISESELTEEFPYMLYWHIMNVQTGFEISKDLLKVKSYQFSPKFTNYKDGEVMVFETKEQTLEYLEKELKKINETL